MTNVFFRPTMSVLLLEFLKVFLYEPFFQSELELLLLDESEEKKHFSYKDILDQENMKKSKKKRRKNKQDILNKPEDTFEIDVKDDRFKALYSSHLFALDPSEPSFK